MTILDIGRQNGPLCPQAFEPKHPLHQLHFKLQDVAYKATPKNEEHEFVSEDADKMYQAITSDRYQDYMYMYRHHNTDPTYPLTTVITYWYRCNICGFVLPATAVETYGK